MSHTIDEFQCTECQQTHKDIPIKKLFLPTEKQPSPVVEFACPNCKAGYLATTYVKDFKQESMTEATKPTMSIKIIPHEPHANA